MDVDDPEPEEIELEDRPTALLADLEPSRWARERPPPEGEEPAAAPASARPATIELDGAHALVRAHDAFVSAGGRASSDEEQEFELSPDDVAHIGTASVRIAVRVRATIEVRNAF